MAGSNPNNPPNNQISRPLWLLAELTYACPLQCPYCSNPTDFAQIKNELSSDEWIRVFREARAMGATQLGFSGGEPLSRPDLLQLITEARQLGFYTNLITSGIGMTADKVAQFREAGLDHIQISFQASTEELNNHIAGTDAFQHKLEMAKAVKANGYPMVLCFVTHRHNIDQIEDMLQLAIALEADYVELATTQYYGWALHNRDQLLPSKQQLQRAEAIAHRYQEHQRGKMKIYYVIPDYYEQRPKPCMNGWGNVFLTIAPDGTALPCHSARDLPGMSLPNVRETGIAEIWKTSNDFNRFRGLDWMKEPCRSCSEKEKDFGGCRCQAFMLTGDPANTDPVCSKSPHHQVILDAIEKAAINAGPADDETRPLLFRNPQNSRLLHGK